jgi:hypothetical protein
LGVAALDCHSPSPNPPTNASSFKSGCDSSDRKAACCGLPLLGKGLLCDALN